MIGDSSRTRTKVVALFLVGLLVLGGGAAALLSGFGGSSDVDAGSVSPQERPVILFLQGARSGDCAQMWAQLTDEAATELEQAFSDYTEQKLDRERLRELVCTSYSGPLADAEFVGTRTQETGENTARVEVDVQVGEQTLTEPFEVVRASGDTWKVTTGQLTE